MARQNCFSRLARPFVRCSLVLWGCLFHISDAFALDVVTDVTVDTNWSLGDSPVTILKSDFRVHDGATLSIQSGVTVKITDAISVSGKLITAGTATSPVVLEPADGISWNGILFTRDDCGQSLKQNVLQGVVFLDLRGGVFVDRQSLDLANSDIAVDGDASFAVRAYNDGKSSCPGSLAKLRLVNNRIVFDTTYSGSYPDSAKIVWIDGMMSEISGNTVLANFSGDATSVTGVLLDISNTSPYVANIHDNDMELNATSEWSDFLTGIRIAHSGVFGTIERNKLVLNARNEIHGIVANANDVIGNEIVATSHSDFNISYEVDVIGVESYSHDVATRLDSNHVVLSSPDKRYLIGMLCQSGGVQNNRIVATLTGRRGYAIGILQQFGSAIIEYNSVLLSGTSSTSLYGLYLPASGSGETLVFSGNIIAAQGSLDATGMFAAATYQGTIFNDGNILYNFTNTYNGVNPGDGDLTLDPLFTDPFALTLSPDSPAFFMSVPAGARLVTKDTDTTPPQVVGATPTGGTVKVTSALTIEFSEELDGTSVVPGTITLNGVSGTLTYSGTTAVFTPSQPLAYATSYVAAVSGVHDLAGNTMTEAYSWSFVTETAPPPPPVIRCGGDNGKHKDRGHHYGQCKEDKGKDKAEIKERSGKKRS